MLKMKKISIILTILALTLLIKTASSTTLDSYQFCKTMQVADWTDFTKPVGCINPTSSFLTTDTAAYVVVKFSNLTEGEEIAYEIIGPSGVVIIYDSQTIPQNMSLWYDYRKMVIAEENREPGDYTVTIYVNGQKAVSGIFTINEEVSNLCETQGFYCCPSSKVCLSAKEGGCSAGFCCESEAKCVTFSPSYFSRREVTNCTEEGIKDCGKVLKLYEYDLHGKIAPPQTAVIYYRDVDVDCSDKTDIAIAYYDETVGAWAEKTTSIEETQVNDTYKATALIDNLGYIALIRTKECVPVLCAYGGYTTDPISSRVNYNESITFELCGLLNGCDATKDGVCNKKCTSGVDFDCKSCTSAQGDCCLISNDEKCDLDCASLVDPGCCDKSRELCCPGSQEQSGSAGCDKNCGTSDASCTGCTTEKDNCCKPDSDSICDLDCPKLVNGIGYLDPDCCTANNIPINSQMGNCCQPVCDGTCDFDCITGLDPDCYNSKCAYCGNGVCDGTESCASCPSDCFNVLYLPPVCEPVADGGGE